MKVNAFEYERLKRFFTWAFEQTSQELSLSEQDKPPLVFAEAEDKFGLAKAKQGLLQGCRDYVEKFSRVNGDLLRAVDEQLKASGAITLSELRQAFSSDLKRIEKRGAIQNEDEFYLVRNACEIPLISADGPRLEELQRLLGDFEFGPETNNPPPKK